MRCWRRPPSAWPAFRLPSDAAWCCIIGLLDAPQSVPVQTSRDLDAMHAEHARLEALGKLFGCSELLAGVSAAIKATTDELAALAALWQQAAVTHGKLAEWNHVVGWA